MEGERNRNHGRGVVGEDKDIREVTDIEAR